MNCFRLDCTTCNCLKFKNIMCLLEASNSGPRSNTHYPLQTKRQKNNSSNWKAIDSKTYSRKVSVLSTTILSPSTLLRILEAVLDLAVSSIHPAKNKPARCTCAVPHALGSSNYGMGRYVAVVDIGKGLNNLFPTRGLPTHRFLAENDHPCLRDADVGRSAHSFS